METQIVNGCEVTFNKLTHDEIKALWGEDLYSVFAAHIDEYGRLTASWEKIIENEIPRFDKNYNDNPLYEGTYQKMYSIDCEISDDELLIWPI